MISLLLVAALAQQANPNATPPAPNPNATPPAREEVKSTACVTVDEDHPDAILTLEGSPPSAITCTLIKDATTEERIVRWDPQASTGRSRRVHLGNGHWKIFCASAPAVRRWYTANNVSLEHDISWKFKDEASIAAISAVKAAPPSLTDARRGLQRLPDGAAVRSLESPISPLVLDTLTILADIAQRRARAGMFDAIMGQFSVLLCETLRVPENMDLGPLSDARSGALLLPHTCETVRTLRLHDLANAGPGLTRSLQEDAEQLAIDLVVAVATTSLSASAHSIPPWATKLIAAIGDTASAPPTVTELLTGPSKILADCAQIAQKYQTSTTLNAADLTTEQTTNGHAQKINKAHLVRLVQITEELKNLPSPRTLPASAPLLVEAAHLVVELSKGDPNVDQHLQLPEQLHQLTTLHALRPIMDAVRPFLIELASDPEQIDVLDAQQLVTRLGQAPWKKIVGGPPGCALELTFAVAGTCIDAGGCHPGEVTAMLRDPTSYFSDAESCDTAIDRWPQIDDIAESVLRVLSAGRNGEARAQVRAAVDVAFDMIDLAIPSSTAFHPEDRPSPVLRDLLGHLRAMSLALVDQDVPSVVRALVGAVSGVLDHEVERDMEGQLNGGTTTLTDRPALFTIRSVLTRVSAIATTLATNAQLLAKADEDDADREALRKARTDAIEELIDAFTQRTDRGHQWVVSLGSPVGFTFGPQLADGQWNWSQRQPDLVPAERSGDPLGKHGFGLSIPVGFALQRLPRPVDPHYKAALEACKDDHTAKADGKNESACDCRKKLAHLQLRPAVGGMIHFAALDVGNLLLSDSFYDGQPRTVAWQDLLVFQAMAGVMPQLGRTTPSELTLGAFFRVTPAGPNRGDISVGLAFTWYVPFIDFN